MSTYAAGYVRDRELGRAALRGARRDAPGPHAPETKTFSGDVEGESAAELLMAYGFEEGSAAHVGLEARDRQRPRPVQ